jgi:hypothetical protein
MSARTYKLIEQYRNALDILCLYTEHGSLESSELTLSSAEAEMTEAASELVDSKSEVLACVAYGDLKGMQVYGHVHEFRDDLVILSVQGELIECTVASLTSVDLLVAC